MKAGTFFRHKSLTKNWPGGRRNATVPVKTKEKFKVDGKEQERTVTLYRDWSRRIVNTKATWDEAGNKTYLEPLPPASEGGMAEPQEL